MGRANRVGCGNAHRAYCCDSNTSGEHMDKFNLGEVLRHLPFGNKEEVVGTTLQAARTQIDGLVSQAVDHLAGLVPGGEQYTPQAKQAITSALNTLQQQLEQEASRRLGGQPPS